MSKYFLLFLVALVTVEAADLLPDEAREQLSEMWVLHGLNEVPWEALNRKTVYLGRMEVAERDMRNVPTERFRENHPRREEQLGLLYTDKTQYKKYAISKFQLVPELSIGNTGMGALSEKLKTDDKRKAFVLSHVHQIEHTWGGVGENSPFYWKRIPVFGLFYFERDLDVTETVEGINEWWRAKENVHPDKDLLNAFDVHAFPKAWKEDFSEALRRFSSIPEENRLEEVRSGSDTMSDFLVYLLVQGLSEEELNELDVFAILEREDDPVLRKAVWYDLLVRAPSGSALETFRKKLRKDALGSGMLEAFLWAYAAKQGDESGNFIFAFLYRFETPERVADGPYSLRARAEESGRSGYDVRDHNFSLFVDVAERLEETEQGRRVVDQLYWVLYDTAIGFEPEPVLGHWKMESDAVPNGEKGKEAD